MKRRWLTVMAILAMLLGLLLGSVFAAPLAAQVVVPVPGPELTVNVAVVNDGAADELVPYAYLPIVVAPGQPGPPPDSPYAAALSQALADCAGTTLNQVCYAGGSVTLDGGGPLTTPGQVATLDGVSGLTLVSPDAGHWSVALLRLAADSSTPDLGLTLLAFGNVQIRNLALFDAATGNGDVAPALSFSSSPAPGEDPVTGGLIVYNPADEEPLAIRLNGADLTLASSGVVQAKPGDKMTVTMATGSGLVQTPAGDGALIQGHQLTVALDGNGNATGAPTAPTVTDEELLAPLTCEGDDCLLTPLLPEPRPLDIRRALLAFQVGQNSAYDRCLQGDSRQVYRLMYFARILKEFARLYPSLYPESMLDGVDLQVRQCATFEMEFNSVITVTSSAIWGNMYIQGQGMIVSYHMDGSLVQPAQMPLTHLRYDIDIPPGCPYQAVLTDGRLVHFDGYMRINRNRLDISTTINPVDSFERFIYYCPGGSFEMNSPALWETMFRQLHASEQIIAGFRFTPAHWKYTGNQILAEAIFTDREAMVADGVCTGDTWLVMLHKPRK